jgi:hypothetical protein
MLLASSTHTQEVESFVQETAHLTSGMDVVVCEPFFEIPYMRAHLKSAVVAMAEHVRQTIPSDVADQDIGVLLASHGTPYVPPSPEFGWQEGEIFSNLLPTEDAFHDEIKEELPWTSLTGRMNYASPSLQESLAAFEADGFSHVMVIPSAFPTAAMHTMWDVAEATVGRAVLRREGVVVHTRPSGMKVYYSAQGFADMEPGRSEFRAGLKYIGEKGVKLILAPEIQITGVSSNLVANPQPGDEVRLTMHAVGPEGMNLAYRSSFRAGYGLPNWGGNSWEMIQDLSPANGIELRPESPGNYFLVGHVVPEGGTWEFGDSQGGFNIVCGGDIQITGVTTELTSSPAPSQTFRFTLNATGPKGVPLNYRFYSRAGYGLDPETWGGNKWKLVQDWSSNNSVDYTFPASGIYYLVGHVTAEGESWEFGDAQGGFNVIVK